MTSLADDQHDDVVASRHGSGGYSMSYENAINTRQMATVCVFCNKELVNAASVEHGCGDICLENYGAVGAPGPVDAEKLKLMVETAPEKLKADVEPLYRAGDLQQLVQRSIWHAAVAAEFGGEHATEVLVTAHGLAQAAGYGKTAAQIAKMQIKPRAKSEIRVEHKGGLALIFTPYNAAFVAAIKTVPGRRYGKYPEPHNSVPIDKMPEAVNALVAGFPGQVVLDADGSYFAIPMLPVVIAPPVTPPAGPPTAETGETPEPRPKELRDLSIGQMVIGPDGKEYEVGWIGQKSGEARLGLRVPGQRGFTFLSYSEVKYAPKSEVAALARDEAAEHRKDAREAGAPPPVELPMTERRIPERMYAYQIDGVRWFDKVRSGLLADEMGTGKELSVDEPVLTPTGWKRIGDLRVGDQVCDPDGGVADVTGVFPQGVKPLYRMTFGDHTEVLAGAEHRWLVFTAIDRNRGGKGRVKTTSELMAEGLRGKVSAKGWANRKWFLPVNAPVELEPRGELPIDPYVLGVLLGDGTFRHVTVSFTLPDGEIATEVARRHAPREVRLVRSADRCPSYSMPGLADDVRVLGLDGHLSVEKFIPDVYLYAPVEARLDLLHGLMDTDGDCSKGHPVFNTSSPRLRDDVMFLVRSLGGLATSSTKEEPKYTYKDEVRTGQPAYRVNVRLPENPFFLPRKAALWTEPNLTKGIESIEPAGEGEAVCIAVASKRSLFMTRDFTVTHNTGTSIVALDVPALVLCPATLRVNWAREIAMWRPELTSQILSGRKPVDPKTLTADIVVCNYDIVDSQLESLLTRKWTTFVADEAHYMKTLRMKKKKSRDDEDEESSEQGVTKSQSEMVYTGSKRAAAGATIAREARRRILLTGTPILNRPVELWPLLHIIDPQTWNSFFSFGKRYCAGYKGRFGWDWTGSSNEQELHERLTPKYMLRRLKSEVLKDLPEKQRGSIEVVLEEKRAKIYSHAAREFLAWVAENGGPKAVAAAMRAEVLVKMTSLRRLAAEGKVEAALDWIQEHHDSTGRPLVVMGHHATALNELVEKCREAKLRVGTILGSDPQPVRQQSIDAFQNGQLDVIVCSILAAGVGITLTAAQEMLFLERAWRPADLVQAEDRIHRIGQKNAVQIVYLDGAGTIDQSIARLLMDKVSTIASIIDGVAMDETDAVESVFGSMFTKDLTPNAGGDVMLDEHLAFNWLDPQDA